MQQANPQKPKTINLTIGDYTIKPVPTGIFGLDGGSMFGTVPKVLWERTNPADEQNRIPMEARALLLISNSTSRKILVDAGNGGDFVAKYGDKLGSKFSQLYSVQGNGLSDTLAKFNVAVDEITDVILTHLHFDHAGGATCARDGKVRPTFPKAQYYVQKANLETARTPNLRERASYLPANFEPLIEAGVLKILDGPVQNLLPGIDVFVSNGHTVGQQLVRVDGGAGPSLVYCGDLIPTSTHVRLPFVMGYDQYPLTVIEEKRELLNKAARGNWYLYFEHDPYVDASCVEPNHDDFKVRESFCLA